MAGWDTGAVMSANLNLRVPVESGQQPLTYVDAQNQFRQFLRTHLAEDGSTYPYRDDLKANFNEGQYFVSEGEQRMGTLQRSDRRRTQRDDSHIPFSRFLLLSISLCARRV